jgi:hypothetical protein
MKSPTTDCGSTGPMPASRKRDCVPCAIPPFCRSNYYRGKLLTERDFRDEQRYFADKARLHNLALHGWGIVCGLAVRPHPHCPQLRVVVEPGLAIDTCGREIRVLEGTDLLLPQPPPKTTPDDDCPPDDPTGKPHVHSDTCGCEGPPPVDLYICVRYSECDTELTPAPFDECGCGSDSQQANRICEGYELELHQSKPDWWDDATKGGGCDDTDDCVTIYDQTVEHCPDRRCFPCLPLAIIRGVTLGEPVTKDQIDNVTPRRVLPNIELLDELLRCILDKLPTKTATRISSFGWSHGERYACHEFFSRFVGGDAAPEGFRIDFDSDVDAPPIDTRSFQATVVYRSQDPSEPRKMEVAPAKVDRGAGATTKTCALRIDPTYAKRYLDGNDFDLYITLRCDVITGLHGLAVDGNLLARHEDEDVYRVDPPTGDGIPGGEFVSWIRVRSGRNPNPSPPGGATGYGYANAQRRR